MVEIYRESSLLRNTTKRTKKNIKKKKHRGGVLTEQFVIPEEGICGIEKEVIQNLLYKSDPFEALGLSSDVTKEDINKRYKKLALKIHPDKCDNSKVQIIFQYLRNNYIASLKKVDMLEKIDESEGIDNDDSRNNIDKIKNTLIKIYYKLNEIEQKRLEILQDTKGIEYNKQMMTWTIEDLTYTKVSLQDDTKVLNDLHEEFTKLEEEYKNFREEILWINKISTDDKPGLDKVLFEINKLINMIDKEHGIYRHRAYRVTKEKLNDVIEKVDKIIEKKERGTFTERIAKTIQKRIQTIRNRKQKTKGGKKNKTKKIRKN